MFPFMRSPILTALLLWAATTLVAAPPGGESLESADVSPLALNGSDSGVLLLFVAPDCPISNRYAPRIVEIAQRAAEQGIKTWLVYADDLANPTTIRTHQAEYGLTALPTAIDRDFELADYAGADVTPEAIIFAPDDTAADGVRLVYRGRIDDQYEGFGVFRPAATRSELTVALDQLAAGERPKLVTTKAIGCYIPRPE